MSNRRLIYYIIERLGAEVSLRNYKGSYERAIMRTTRFEYSPPSQHACRKRIVCNHCYKDILIVSEVCIALDNGTDNVRRVVIL